MIDVLGVKRLLGLLVMAGLVIALAAAHYMVLMPHQEKVERELRSLEGQISTRQAETQQLRDEFAALDSIKFRYNQLQSYGFVGDQDRIFARSKINELRDKSGVLGVRYEIKPLQEEENQKIQEAGYKLLKSEIDFNIDAFDDVEIYKFIYLLNHGFPGEVNIRAINIARVRDVSVPLLQSIGSGAKTPLASGQVVVDWYTISENTEVDNNGQ